MFTRLIAAAEILLFVTLLVSAAFAQSAKTLYDQLGPFTLVKSARVDNYVLKVDRATMTLTGTLYFAAPVNGRHTSAIFLGNGKFSAPVPDTEFEKAYVRRLLKTDVVESDFTSAVFRMTDGSLESVASSAQPAASSSEAQKLALEHNPKLLKETGANIAARIAVSLANNEKSGVFVSTFDGGKLDDFSFVFDPLTRIPTNNFDLNGGEKGVIFTNRTSLFSSEVLMAFYSLSDYQRRTVNYSDLDDLVDITSYDIELDLRTPRSKINERATIKMTALADGIVAIPFNLG